MNRATPQMREFSKRLIVYETRQNNTSQTKIPPGIRTCEKLHAYLAQFMGNAGFRALLSRAVALASLEVAWLGTVHVKSDGSLEGLEALQWKLGPDELFEARVVLVAHLLGLLVAFIGESLTLHLLREIWPKLLFLDLGSVKETKNEEPK